MCQLVLRLVSTGLVFQTHYGRSSPWAFLVNHASASLVNLASSLGNVIAELNGSVSIET